MNEIKLVSLMSCTISYLITIEMILPHFSFYLAQNLWITFGPHFIKL